MRFGSTPRRACRRTRRTQQRLFHPQSNEIRVAFSIAHGDAERDPQYNTSDVFLYEGIELSTIAFHPSLSTAREAVEHVPRCKALSSSGETVPSRYEALHPNETYGAGVLLLSVADIVAAAGRRLDDLGADGAPLRLSGLEVVAHVDVRNFERPFRWPFAWNPLDVTPATRLDCTVRFSLLRSHFTPVVWYDALAEPVALQHGLRLQVTTSGSVGYFSWEALLTSLLLAFTAFGAAQTLLDAAWYYLWPRASLIADKAFQAIDLTAPEDPLACGSAGGRTRAAAGSQQVPPTGTCAHPPAVRRRSSGSLKSIAVSRSSPPIKERRSRSPSSRRGGGIKDD